MPISVRAARKPSLSPTKISTYLTCPLKYRYVYLDKIGKYYQKSRSYFSFGTSLHQTLETYHTSETPPTVEQMSERLDTAWISAGYQDKQQEAEHKSLGQEIVQAYHSSQVERIEQQVETIATEKTLKWDMDTWCLTGRVDRLDRHPDGTIEIVDYKSGKKDNVLIAPPKLRNAIQPDDDYTGAKYKVGQKYIVMDVFVASFPDHDPVVWLRLNTAD